MKIIRLGQGALDYVIESLRGNRGLAGRILPEEIKQPFTFDCKNASFEKLNEPKFGGVTSQVASDAQLNDYIHTGKRGEKSIIIQDPWSEGSEHTYFEEIPTSLIISDKNIYYAYDISCFGLEEISMYRSHSVSYLKLIYTTRIPANILLQAGHNFPSIADSVAGSIVEIFVSAYDDEGWIGVDLT